ncbi:MAG: AraC family transcriptional regulator [Rhodoferax sp.]
MDTSAHLLAPKLLDWPAPAPGHPQSLVFRSASVPAHGLYAEHQHAWGEFVAAYSGVMEVKVAQHHYLAPPSYGIWLPPDLPHTGLNRRAAQHCSLYVAPALCAGLPATPCALTIGPLVRALMDTLRDERPPDSAADHAAHQRLLRVLLDRLQQAPRAGSYLPSTDDPALQAVLAAMQRQPHDDRPLRDWALSVHLTERTLMRRAQRELGMPLAQWRQRLRVVLALPRLEAGQSVENVALDLGYSSASAFIAMFKRLMGCTPDEFRRGGTPARTLGTPQNDEEKA